VHGAAGVSPPISLGGGIGVEGSFSSDGVGGIGVYGSATALAEFGNLVGVYGYTDDPTSYAIYGEGGLATTGPIATVTETKSYGLRETYAVHAAGNWCEDFGTARLVDGTARVEIDPVYAETVQMNPEYYVFLTPLGDCGLYVSEKQPGYFVVRALGGETPTMRFDYRVTAKRRGFENRRLRSADRIQETTTQIHQDE
jgi:hypothetical protein